MSPPIRLDTEHRLRPTRDGLDIAVSLGFGTVACLHVAPCIAATTKPRNKSR